MKDINFIKLKDKYFRSYELYYLVLAFEFQENKSYPRLTYYEKKSNHCIFKVGIFDIAILCSLDIQLGTVFATSEEVFNNNTNENFITFNTIDL